MKIAVNNIHDVAKWFLHTEPMTHKKLQKLLYFSYGIYLAQNNENEYKLEKSLFQNNFEAWAHGPVDPSIYSLYKRNGINLLTLEHIENYNFDTAVMKALNTTVKIYSKFSADELEFISHNQTAWKNARKGLMPIEASNNPLLDIDIFRTFKKELINE